MDNEIEKEIEKITEEELFGEVMEKALCLTEADRILFFQSVVTVGIGVIRNELGQEFIDGFLTAAIKDDMKFMPSLTH